MLRQEIDLGNFIEQGDIIEIESKRLSHILSQDQKEFQKILQYLIREAVRNIPEHAETDDVWICGQYWHNRDLAEIASNKDVPKRFEFILLHSFSMLKANAIRKN